MDMSWGLLARTEARLTRTCELDAKHKKIFICTGKKKKRFLLGYREIKRERERRKRKGKQRLNGLHIHTHIQAFLIT
jgi:hypothetical protein